MVSPKNGALESLLEHAARSGSIELWRTVMEEAGRRLPAEQVTSLGAPRRLSFVFPGKHRDHLEVVHLS